MSSRRMKEEVLNPTITSEDQSCSNELKMITKEDLQSSWKIPSLAQFVSLCRFSFKLPEVEIEELEDGLLEESKVGSKVVMDLLIALLKGLQPLKGISTNNYEEHLRKQLKKIKLSGECLDINLTEEITFLKLDSLSKLDLLYSLCLSRLDRADVQEAMKNMDAEALRVQPLGCDDLGNEYWYFYGTRLYKQEPSPEKKKNWQEEWVDQKNQSFNKRGRGRPRKHVTRKSECENSDDFETDTSRTGRRYMNIDEKSRWSVVCNTIEDWVDFAEKLKKSKSKCEKALFHTVTDNFLPVLNEIYQEKERKLQEKLKELIPKPEPRRIETRRMTTRKTQNMNGYDSVNAHKEHLVRDRALRLEERNRRATSQVDGRSRSRSARRSYVDDDDEYDDDTFEDRNYRPRQKLTPLVRTEVTDSKSKLLHVFTEVKKQKDAWPFLYPVDESYAPGYYEIIQEPMDLSTMINKLMENNYRTINDIDEDFKKMVSNCKLYNGEHSAMSEMVMSLWRVFRNSLNQTFAPETQGNASSGDSDPSVSYQQSDRDSGDSTYEDRKVEVKKKKKKIRRKEALEILSKETQRALEKCQSGERMQIDTRESVTHSKPGSMFSDLKIVPITNHPSPLIEKFSSGSSSHDSIDMDSSNAAASPYQNQCSSSPNLAVPDAENSDTGMHTNPKPNPSIHYIAPNEYAPDLSEFIDANTTMPSETDNNLNVSFNSHSSSSPGVQESRHARSPPNAVKNFPLPVVSERTVPLLQENFGMNELSNFATSYETSTVNASALGLMSNQTVYRKPFVNSQVPVTTSIGTSSQVSFTPATSTQVNSTNVEPPRSSPTFLAQVSVPQSQQVANQQNQGIQITKESTQYYQYQKSNMEMTFPAAVSNAATFASQLPMTSVVTNSSAQIPLQLQVPYSKAFPNQGNLVLPQPEGNKFPNVKFNLPPSTGEILLVPGDPVPSSMTFHLYAQPNSDPSQPIQSSIELKASNVNNTVEPLGNQHAVNSIEKQITSSRVANREDSTRPQKRKSPLQGLQDLVQTTTTSTSMPSTQKTSELVPGFPGPIRFTDASPNFPSIYPNSSNTVIKPSATLQRPQYNPNNTSISYSSGNAPTGMHSSNLKIGSSVPQDRNMFQSPVTVQKTMPTVYPAADKGFVSVSSNAQVTSSLMTRPPILAPKKFQISSGNMAMNVNSVIQNANGQLVFLPPAKESVKRSAGEEQIPKVQSLGKPVSQAVTCAPYFPSANNTMLQQSFAFQNSPMNQSQIYTQVVPSQLPPQFVNNPYYIITDPNAFQGAQRYPVMNMQPISFTNR